MRLSHFLGKPLYRGILIGFICAAICWWLNGQQIVRNLENWALDICFVYRGVRPGPTEIVIIALDDDSLSQMNKPLMFLSPELADVTAHVRNHGAVAVGIDFMVPANLGAFTQLSLGMQGDARRLGDVVEKHGRIVLPEWMDQNSNKLLLPLSHWMQSSDWTAVGFVNVIPDSDMFVRRQRLFAGKDNPQPSFALAVFAAANNLPAEWAESPELLLDNRPIPVASDRSLLINYRGPAGTITRRSFHAVLEESRGGRSVSDWTDKIVLIGTTSPINDAFATSYINQSLERLLVTAWSQRSPELMPGVEVHANVIATLGDRSFISTPWFLATPLLLLIAGVALSIVLLKLRLEYGLLVVFLHHWVWKFICLIAFKYQGWRVEMVSMLLLGALVFTVIFALRWRWIRRMLGMVKSDAIARALEADPTKLNLKGEEREMTILFSDIRGFTNYSEQHTPREVVNLLNEYFSVVVPTIEECGGVLNQYMGDGMMVLFGAPDTQPKHAVLAVRAAVEMIRRVHSMKQHWEQLGAPEFRIGVGIHTGRVVVGTVGSPNRLDYSAIGDTVNTAARIEAGNKELQTEILISATTLNCLPPDEVELRALVGEGQSLTVKGKKQSIMVHAVSTIDNRSAINAAASS